MVPDFDHVLAARLVPGTLKEQTVWLFSPSAIMHCVQVVAGS